MLAMSVVFLARLRGTHPYALTPFGALARRRLIEVRVPQSSASTRRRGSNLLPTPSRQRLRSRSSRSAAGKDFLERQLEPPEDVALRGGRDPRPFGLLEELEVL